MELTKKQQDHLAEAWIGLLIFNHEASLYTSALEDDGRKRNKFLRDIVENDYATRYGDKYTATSKAYEEIKAEKPTLTFREDYPERPGCHWSLLNTEERKYVIDNSGSYEFSVYDKFNHKVEATFEVGDDKAYAREMIDHKFSDSRVLYVIDEEYRAAQTQFLYLRKFAQLRDEHIPWAMTHFKIIDSANKDVFESGEADAFFHREKGPYGKDPAQWEEQTKARIKSLRERMARDLRKLTVLVDAQEKIEEYGGWPKLVADYEKEIHATLAKDEAEENPPAAELAAKE